MCIRDRVSALVSSEVDSMADVSESGETSAGRAVTVSDGEVAAVVAEDLSLIHISEIEALKSNRTSNLGALKELEGKLAVAEQNKKDAERCV